MSTSEKESSDFNLGGAIAVELDRDPRAEPVAIAQRVVASMPEESLRPTLEQLLPRRVTAEMCEITARRVASGERLAL